MHNFTLVKRQNRLNVRKKEFSYSHVLCTKDAMSEHCDYSVSLRRLCFVLVFPILTIFKYAMKFLS